MRRGSRSVDCRRLLEGRNAGAIAPGPISGSNQSIPFLAIGGIPNRVGQLRRRVP